MKNEEAEAMGRQSPWSARHGSEDLPLGEQVEWLFAYAYRLTGSRDMAEDLAQTAFLVAQQRQGQLRDAAHLRGWLAKILRNLYLKSFRRPQPLVASQVGLEVNEVWETPQRESSCDDEAVQRALDGLRDEFRVVVLMFYFEDLSYREIAAELGVPLGTVMSRLARAREALRRHLAAPEKLAR